MCPTKVCYLILFLAVCIAKVTSYDEDVYDTLNKGDTLDMFTIKEPSATTETDNDDQSEGREIDLTEIKNSIHEKLEYGAMKKTCTFYSHGRDIDVDKMADVWQVVYYQLEKDISCFKIFIRKTTDEEKKDYLVKFGSFSNSVNWSACDLEVLSNEKSDTERRHFLQRGETGIMGNVIILEQYSRDNTTYYLHKEHSDQWMVVQDLLLMRDCADGELVVFARVPRQPRRKDIADALVKFGEYTMEGMMTC